MMHTGTVKDRGLTSSTIHSILAQHPMMDGFAMIPSLGPWSAQQHMLNVHESETRHAVDAVQNIISRNWK